MSMTRQTSRRTGLLFTSHPTQECYFAEQTFRSTRTARPETSTELNDEAPVSIIRQPSDHSVPGVFQQPRDKRTSETARHTTEKQCQTSKRSMFRLKPFQARCQSQHIQQHMKHARMNDRIRIQSIDWISACQRAGEQRDTLTPSPYRLGNGMNGTHHLRIQAHPEPMNPIVPRSTRIVARVTRTQR